MEQSRPRDPPLTVWIVTLNRQVHRDVREPLNVRHVSPLILITTRFRALRNVLYVLGILMHAHRRKRTEFQIVMRLFVSKPGYKVLVGFSAIVGYIMGKLLPALVMRNRHRHLPPAEWFYNVTRSGKDYIVSQWSCL